MTNPPRRAVRQMRFANQRLSRVGLELLSLAMFRAWPGNAVLALPERIDFCLILVVTAGRGEHVVDFQRIVLEPGVVVIVRPGEVQQWCLRAGLEGDVLLIAPHVIRPNASAGADPLAQPPSVEAWPTRFVLTLRERRNWRALTVMLRRELAHPVVDDLSAALARQLYLSLLCGLARAAGEGTQPASAHDRLYRRFQRTLEELVTSRPAVDTLAKRLRVSPTTLNRACHSQAGRSAKVVVDARIALEAQRLLVHSGATSARIGEQLGFSEPTNFLKFFKRQVGVTPEAFRARHRVA